MTTFNDIANRIKTLPFIGGERKPCPNSQQAASYNPADNQLNIEFPLAGTECMNQAVNAARQAFDQGSWQKMGIKKRLACLHKFADLIEANAEFLGTIESYDVGKLLKECIGHDVARASANIRFFASAVEQQTDEAFFSQASFLGQDIKTMSVSMRQPIGVAGLISPWNSPIMLATWKIGPCLAAGNTCVIKPSPWALLSVLQLGELANEAGIPPGVLNIVPGDADAGKTLVSHADVDRISFTGSVHVGKAVSIANAQTRMAAVSLELGGKSPTIVFGDADIDKAVQGVARGIFRSQGQSCVAGSRLLLHESIYDAFLEKLCDFANQMTIGSQLEEKTQIGPIINKEHLEHIETYIEKAIAAGAKAITGGKRPTDSKLAKGNYYEPTVLTQISRDMQVWREEIFGPVLVVMPFSSDRQAIELANDSTFGLSSSLWTHQLDRALTVATDIEAGMVWLNSHFVRDLRAPFGGVKDSGIGSEGGRYSLEFFSKPKMVCFPWNA